MQFVEKKHNLLFSNRHGDWVQFQVATDRRDQLRRATSIALLEESFLVSGERREQGVVAALKEGFGFLRCTERDTRLFFHFNEVLDVDREISVGDEVEFTVVQVCSSLHIFHIHSFSIKCLTVLFPNCVS
jgi:cold shock CspA family protein